MSEFDKARPVSGEIMTGGATRRGPAAPADVSDAEYETVDDTAHADALPRFASAGFASARPATGMDFLKQGAPPKTRGTHGGPLFWMMGLTLVVLAFWVSGGHALVRSAALPTTSDATQPLRIVDVVSRIENQNGRDILFVTGSAENRGSDALALPPIEIAVIGNDGTTTRYFLGTTASTLNPGDRHSFSSRLETPTNGVKTVAVTFQEALR